MHRLFGKQKETNKVPEPSLTDAQASLNLRQTTLDDKIKALDQELIGYKNQLSKVPKGSSQHQRITNLALDVLKRKKGYENQRNLLSKQSFNIDQTCFALETVKDTQITVAALKAASKTLIAENKKIDLDELEELQDDLQDTLEEVNDANEILGRSYGLPDSVDERDLAAELDYLGDELEMMDESSYISQPATADVQKIAPISLPTLPTIHNNKTEINTVQLSAPTGVTSL